jgi:hypothetical protein
LFADVEIFVVGSAEYDLNNFQVSSKESLKKPVCRFAAP